MLDILDGKAIYNKVDELRKAKGWTIYELAKISAVSPTTIYNWRDRGSSPSLTLLDSICSAFEISVINFLLDEDELLALTEEQKELIRLWNTLSDDKKKSILNLIKTM